MSTPTTRELPDRTGMLISPFTAFFCSAIFSALLVDDAIALARGGFESPSYGSVRNQILGEIIEALASALGPIPSIALATVLVVGTGAWLVVVFRSYRVIVAADRAAAR